MALNPQQSYYLDTILDKSEEELIFEVANGMLLGVRAMVEGPQTRSHGSNQPSAEEMERMRNAVPNGPVSEYAKPVLQPHLAFARQKVDDMRKRLYGFLCTGEQQPSAWALDITTGQTKDIIAAVITIMTTSYSVAMSVAIPVSVFLLKKGLYGFCATPPTPLP